MVFAALLKTTLLRPITRTLISTTTNPFLRSASQTPISHLTCHTQTTPITHFTQTPFRYNLLNSIVSLTDTRYPKRKPSSKSRKKRAAFVPKGPIQWMPCVPGKPGEPMLGNKPNAGSVKNRNQKKREKQRIDFKHSERKKRKLLVQEANRKEQVKRLERKMAAVARERAWAERLVELQRLEVEKKAAATA